MEDNFYFDEDVRRARNTKKKLAYKEEVAKAKTFWKKLKSKYYDEIKLRPRRYSGATKSNGFFQ